MHAGFRVQGRERWRGHAPCVWYRASKVSAAVRVQGAELFVFVHQLPTFHSLNEQHNTGLLQCRLLAMHVYSEWYDACSSLCYHATTIKVVLPSMQACGLAGSAGAVPGPIRAMDVCAGL